MPTRKNLIKAREDARLSRTELADRIGAERRAVGRWEKCQQTPSYYFQRKIVEVLGNDDPHLFDIVSGETESPQPCTPTPASDRLDSSDSPDIPESKEESDMDKRRREIIGTIATGAIAVSTGISLVTNTQIITGPVIDGADYLPMVRLAIDTAWDDLSSGNFPQLQRAVNAHAHTLGRFAHTVSPFQKQAASLAVQMAILRINLANHDMRFGERELCCIEAEQFGALSGDRNLLALTQFWHGDTFTYCYHRPQQAIPLLNDALKNVDGNALVSTIIYADLSIAHAQAHDETKALDYMEMARSTMFSHPESDPLYKSVQLGTAELDQDEGKTLLYLAKYIPSYANKAYAAFNKSTGKQARSKGYQVQALTRKADALRLLGEKGECIKNLSGAYELSSGVHRLTQIDAVLSCVPAHWRRETDVQKLQKDVDNALALARQ
jgi:transcriptional regulator with XRE-family HTH domain